MRAAKAAGLTESHDTLVLRVEGDNEAGLAFRLTQQWALAGISLQGLTMSVLGNKFVGYAKFDTVADVNKAVASHVLTAAQAHTVLSAAKLA